MSFSANWLQLILLALGGLLLLIALAHTLTAWRFGGRMPLTAITNAIFIAGVVAITFLTWSMLSSVDWAGSFTVDLPVIHLKL